MRHLIIGTAGHIDHGKTTLIKALTGRETDRLEEEKKRGISIELGFTYFDLPSGIRAGIVDVPGHEKFIKNMLAGVAGMDIVVLVVAADEGVMAQTREHLEILRFTGIKKGIIALTKSDLVDEEWLEMAKEDVMETVKGTFLEDAPLFAVSSHTKQGMPELIEALDEIAQELPDRSEDSLVRYGIDRVFTISGFGTVVTGTLVAGKLVTGQDVMIYPPALKAKVRNLQVHDQNEDTAHAGQRVAINLAGVSKDELDRGFVLSEPDALVQTSMLDVVLTTVGLPFPLENRTRLRLYIGTTEVLCRVALLDSEVLESNQTGTAQLRLEEPIAVQPGDHFVVRLYSPLITVGGGVIVDSSPQKKKKFHQDAHNPILALYEADPEEALLLRLKTHEHDYPTLRQLAAISGETGKAISERVEALKNAGKVRVFDSADAQTVLTETRIEELAREIEKAVEQYHMQYPLRLGIAKEALRSSLLAEARNKVGEKILQALLTEGGYVDQNGIVAKGDFEIRFTQVQEEAMAEIEAAAHAELMPVKVEELGLAPQEYPWIGELVQYMVREKKLTRLEEDILVSTEKLEAGIDAMKAALDRDGKITVAQTRDALNTNRKIALSLLSMMDQRKITKRIGDERVPA